MRLEDLNTDAKPNWCPGCGDFGILNALKGALVELDVAAKDVVLVSGIGCGSKTPHWVNTYGFHGIHGRLLPVATGVKLANHNLTVIGIGGDGDGDGFAEGTNHFIHAVRRNLDITYIIQNNQIFGLTQGQASPTSDQGFVTKSTPAGTIEPGLIIPSLPLAIASGSTFVARGFAGDMKHLQELIVAAVKHKGFSVVEVLQPCVVWNKKNTYDWYSQRIYKLEDGKYDSQDKLEAFKISTEWSEKIPTGIFYKEDKKTYEEYLPQIAEEPLVEKKIDDVDISKVMDSFI